MFKTLRTLFKIIVYLFRSRKELKIAQKLDKEGNLVERDKIVDTKVPDWAKFCIDATGSSVNVKGEELIPTDRAVVFIANHQGNMDIPTLLGFIKKPKAFVSKIEILKVPILSKWMALMQCTFLDRKNMRQSVQAMAEAVETIKKGYSLVIFPEGTRSKGGPVKEFKAGSFKLAFKSGWMTDLMFMEVTPDGAVSRTSVVASSDVSYYDPACVRVSPTTGMSVVLWPSQEQEASQIRVACKPTASEAFTVSTLDAREGVTQRRVDAEFDSAGRLHIVWADDRNGDSQIWYVCMNCETGEKSQPLCISGDGAWVAATLALDEVGLPYIVAQTENDSLSLIAPEKAGVSDWVAY